MWNTCTNIPHHHILSVLSSVICNYVENGLSFIDKFNGDVVLKYFMKCASSDCAMKNPKQAVSLALSIAKCYVKWSKCFLDCKLECGNEHVVKKSNIQFSLTGGLFSSFVVDITQYWSKNNV